MLITITLLAFLVLLLVSLASLTRVETQVAANNQQLALARQNAQFALDLALGRLQSAAGKDRRITATAGAFAATVNVAKKNWTGVWNSETASTPTLVEWLVSDTTPNPAGAPAASGTAVGNSVLLLGPGTLGPTASADDQVRTERRAITSKNIPGFDPAVDHTIGHYAWWIGDEGVKLNLAVPSRIDQLDAINAGFADDADRDRLAQRLAHRTGAETFSAFSLQSENDAASLARWQGLRRILAPSQLKLPSALGVDSVARDYLARNTHVFTAVSRGVLADSSPRAAAIATEIAMKRGGLRKNLSDPANGAALPAAWFQYTLFRPVSTAPGSLPEIRQMPYTGNVAQVHPLLTEAAFDLVPFRNSSGRLAVRMRLKIEIANPYAVPIYHDASVQYGAYQAKIQLSDTTRSDKVPYLRVNATGSSTTSNIRLDASSTGIFQLAGLSGAYWTLPIVTSLQPGEVRTITQEITYNTGATLASASSTIDYNITANRMSLIFAIPIGGLPGSTDLTTYQNLPYATGSRASVPWTIDQPMDTIYRERGVSYHARVNSAAQSWRDWTRSKVHDASALFDYPVDLYWDVINLAPGADADVAHWQACFETVVGAIDFTSPPSPVDLAMTGQSQFAASEFFSSARRIPCIKDVPLGPLFSVGELTHLPFWHQNSGAPEEWMPDRRTAFALGRPEGGTKINESNAVFDRAFFVPLPAAWQPGDLLPNYRLQTVAHSTFGSPARADLEGQDAALFLLSHGTFNINSTSVPAWQGLLGRSIVNWLNHQGRPPSGTGDGQPVLRNPVVARPQTAHCGTEVVTADDFAIRQLTDTEIAGLAGEIVARIDARTTPFTCLRDFFGSGLLDQAIAAAGLNQALIDDAAASGDEHRLGGEQWVSPEKIAAALAPFLAARSDTFLIRTYGAAVNPATGQLEGEAWLEAVVQRMPELVDPGAAPTRAAELKNTAAAFGRRFKIVSFRWLSPTDL